MLALFTFYALPSGGKSKGTVVHYLAMFNMFRAGALVPNKDNVVVISLNPGTGYSMDNFEHLFCGKNLLLIEKTVNKLNRCVLCLNRPISNS